MTGITLESDNKALARLGEVDTPTVANAFDLLKVRPPQEGFADRRLSCRFPELGVMVGYAVTVTMRTAVPPAYGTDVYSVIERLLDVIVASPKPVVVVLQDLDERPHGALFGELMAKAFMTFGARGIVSNGTGRDLDAIRQMGMSAFTTGAVCAKACAHLLDINVSANICGAAIRPGDLLHGDANGMFVLPAEHIEATCKRIVDVNEAEAEILNYLESSDESTVAGFAESRKRCAARLRRSSG